MCAKNYTGKTVYTVNAKTNTVDEWICFGEFTGVYQERKERLCYLGHNGFSCVLPKRCVFLSKAKALAVK